MTYSVVTIVWFSSIVSKQLPWPFKKQITSYLSKRRNTGEEAGVERRRNDLTWLYPGEKKKTEVESIK